MTFAEESTPTPPTIAEQPQAGPSGSSQAVATSSRSRSKRSVTNLSDLPPEEKEGNIRMLTAYVMLHRSERDALKAEGRVFNERARRLRAELDMVEGHAADLVVRVSEAEEALAKLEGYLSANGVSIDIASNELWARSEMELTDKERSAEEALMEDEAMLEKEMAMMRMLEGGEGGSEDKGKGKGKQKAIA